VIAAPAWTTPADADVSAQIKLRDPVYPRRYKESPVPQSRPGDQILEEMYRTNVKFHFLGARRCGLLAFADGVV